MGILSIFCDPILLEHLGDAQLKKGETAQALASYQHSLKFATEKDKTRITDKIDGLLPKAAVP